MDKIHHKIRRPKRIPQEITVRFDLLGTDEEKLSQYMYFKALEAIGYLSVHMQCDFECNALGQPVAELVDLFGGLLDQDDLPAVVSAEVVP